ncbi:unnamed protein product [Rotaria sordida]|uniref:Fatty acid synthase n=1 Tax=Rotaria sordida TaxID=392033 RepID=A0A815SZY3_9BILA|nr:unnamed protein product [Rotaria sordida]
MQATPATWRLLTTVGWQAPKGFKILCGGEALSLNLTEQLWKKGSTLWNLYGPTETTIWSIIMEINSLKSCSIGRPIANTYIYILDKNYNPVPIGMSGEIYIGGAGVARGYLNHPQLTAEKFIANPFASIDKHPRLYKTGDLGRYLPNGNIEYLNSIDINKLRVYLQKTLPEYMVPWMYQVYNTFPKTDNNKIDRKQLQMQDTKLVSVESDIKLPSTQLEKQVASIWEDVLGIKIRGINDNFFALGGHSLTAAQLISRMRTNLKIEIPLKLIFDSPTISQLISNLELKTRN